MQPSFHIVLHEPEIPNNTGNIGRTCVGLNAKLHLIKPLGFSLEDKMLKRSGLDYWPDLDWQVYENIDECLDQIGSERIFCLSTKGQKSFFEFQYQQGDVFVFGKETKGLPVEIREAYKERCVKLPMIGPIRSYNLANAVAVVSFEALRQIKNF